MLTAVLCCDYIDGLVLNCSIPSVLAVELHKAINIILPNGFMSFINHVLAP